MDSSKLFTYTRFLLACFLAFALFAGSSSKAYADRQLDENCNIIVSLKDELGNSFTGGTVTLQLPGKVPGFTSLDDGVDYYITKTDGVDDDDGVGPDGDVEFDAKEPFIAIYFDGNLKIEAPGNSYRVFSYKTGYVDYTVNATYTCVDGGLTDETVVHISSNKFPLIVTNVKDELSNNIITSSSDEPTIYTSADCSGVQTTPASAPTFSTITNAWYIAAPPGTYSTRYRKSGFVDACNTTMVTAASGSQANIDFTAFPLDYGLKVEVNDQDAQPLSGVTLTHGGAAPAHSNQGANGNEYYFTSTGTHGLGISKTGFQTILEASNNVESGGADVEQTELQLTGTANGAIGNVPAADPGVTIRNGLTHDFNVQVTILKAPSLQGVTGLDLTTYFNFEDSGGAPVTVESMSEVNSVLYPGVYNFKVATSAATLQTVDLDYDADTWIDAVDSAKLPLTGIDSTLQNFGSIVAYQAADHILLEAEDFVTDATGTVSVTVLDNDNMGISTGPHSGFGIIFTLSGGAANSKKDIVSTTLGSQMPADLSGASDVSASGTVNPVTSTATIYIVETIITESTPLLLSVSPRFGTLPQNAALNTTNLPVDVRTGNLTGAKLVVQDIGIPSETAGLGIAETITGATVTIQLQDKFGNLLEIPYSFRIKTTKSAFFRDVIQGSMSQSSSSETQVQTSEGIFSCKIDDTVEEIVTVTVIDSLDQLDDSSSKRVWFLLKQDHISITPPGDGTITAGEKSGAFIIEYQDTYENPKMVTATTTVQFSIVQDSHVDTGVFLDALDNEILSVDIPTGHSTATFYFKDTKSARSLTLEGTVTGVPTGEAVIIIEPAAPINAQVYPITVTEKFTAPSQPTTYGTTQTYSSDSGDITMLSYPYTDSADSSLQILGYQDNKSTVSVQLRDIYGNAISNESISLTTVSDSQLSTPDIGFEPTTIVTDSSGNADISLYSTKEGSTHLRIDLLSYSYDYGEPFYVYFIRADSTPPVIDRYEAFTLVDGDLVDANGPIRIYLHVYDTGPLASGVDWENITVSVTNSSSLSVAEDSWSPLVYDVGADAPSGDSRVSVTADANGEYNVIVAWYPASEMSPGEYSVTIDVVDHDDNHTVKSWTVVVPADKVIQNVMSGPGMFDPRSGEPLTISFQSPYDNTYITLDIYNRSGQLVHTESRIADAGYNEFQWLGRVMGGSFAGNGVYAFRIYGYTQSGQTVEQYGRFALFKK